MRSAPRFIVVTALAVAMLQGCGKSTPSTPTAPTPTPLPSLGSVEPALVGTWSGTLEGSFGPGTFTMTLASTGSVTTVNTGGSSNYCAVSGDWGVAAGQFTGRGSDCTGTIVTFSAPSSSTRLAGTWSATSGRSGTFAVTKQ
jgi:uncharacterized membrane protein YfcA